MSLFRPGFVPSSSKILLIHACRDHFHKAINLRSSQSHKHSRPRGGHCFSTRTGQRRRLLEALVNFPGRWGIHDNEFSFFEKLAPVSRCQQIWNTETSRPAAWTFLCIRWMTFRENAFSETAKIKAASGWSQLNGTFEDYVDWCSN